MRGARKLVLSRKGFDSGYGGMPSPILPDGRLLPLPIPSPHDAFTLGDVNARGVELAPLLADLNRGRHGMGTTVHLDPDLDRKPALRPEAWRPALGQTGGSQTHLQRQGVAPGDVFLFFGWFRQVERDRGRWRFERGAPDLHVLFGWLEIGAALPVVRARDQCITRYPWIADHPHVAHPQHYSDTRNTLYIAPRQSAYAPNCHGGGVFWRYSAALRLTAERSSRSVWSLPGWFHPDHGRVPLSYHSDPKRWSRDDGLCRLRSVAKGQEFVLDVSDCPQAQDWVHRLIAGHHIVERLSAGVV